METFLQHWESKPPKIEHKIYERNWLATVFTMRRPLNEHKYAKIPIMTDDVWQSVNWVRWMDQILFCCLTDRVAIFIVLKGANQKSLPLKFMVKTNWWAATITTSHISLCTIETRFCSFDGNEIISPSLSICVTYAKLKIHCIENPAGLVVIYTYLWPIRLYVSVYLLLFNVRALFDFIAILMMVNNRHKIYFLVCSQTSHCSRASHKNLTRISQPKQQEFHEKSLAFTSDFFAFFYRFWPWG